MGTNIPGKAAAPLSYNGGFTQYRERIDAASAAGYAGFAIRC